MPDQDKCAHNWKVYIKVGGVPTHSICTKCGKGKRH